MALKLKYVFAKAFASVGIYTPATTRHLVERSLDKDDPSETMRLIRKCPSVLSPEQSLRHGSLSILDLAVLRDRAACVAALAAEYPQLLTQTDDDGRTILAQGAHRIEYKPRHALALVAAGCPVDARDNHGWTSLHVALAIRPTTDFAAALADAGADVNAASGCGLTPLMVAARRGAPEQVRLLLRRGAEINAVDKDGVSAVWHATAAKELDTAALLIAEGARLDPAETIVQEAVKKAQACGHTAFLEAVEGLRRDEQAKRQRALSADVDRLNAEGLAHTVSVRPLKLKMK